MAGAGFKTFTAGEVFTASDANTYLMQQAVMVFTNEAARDAAITAPSEGMHAYLTAPTIPAATGGATYIPTGITTVYNGSAWVCVTPVGAFTSNEGTSTSNTYTTTLSGSPGTNPSVTLSTGTTVLIQTSGEVYNSGTGYEYMVVSVSGATTIAAADDNGAVVGGVASVIGNVATSFILSGLTAGTNTFTLSYRVSANTGTWRKRRIIVVGIA